MTLHDDRQEEGPALREMRRSYHDRIAGVRESSLSILRVAVAGTAAATGTILGEPAGEPVLLPEVGEIQARAADVDAEVVSLLALESPVARDLRVILATRDVTQLGLLCIGLCAALSGRASGAARSLTAGLRDLVDGVGRGTEGLLRGAEVAWAMLDVGLAEEVPAAAERVRAAQTDFIAGLIALDGVPMDSALDLAMVARAFERLADHGVEIAERVLFAVQGTPRPVAPPAG